MNTFGENVKFLVQNEKFCVIEIVDSKIENMKYFAQISVKIYANCKNMYIYLEISNKYL